jgi:hypothetical protein
MAPPDSRWITRPRAVSCAEVQPAGHDLDQLAVTAPVEIADGQQIHAVEESGKEQRGEHQAHRRAERVAGHALQPVLGKGGADREHGLGAEPGGEDRGHVDVKRQAAAGDEVVARTVHAACGDQPDGDGHGQVQPDKGDQHEPSPRKIDAQCKAAQASGRLPV